MSPHGLLPKRLLCPWVSQARIPGGFPLPPPSDLADPEKEPHVLHWPAGSSPLSQQGRLISYLSLAADDPRCSSTCRCIIPISASVITKCFPCVLCPFPSHKDTNRGRGPTLIQYDLLNLATFAKMPFPNRVTHPGPGETCIWGRTLFKPGQQVSLLGRSPFAAIH